MRWPLLHVLPALCLVGLSAASEPIESHDLSGLLTRIGDHLEQYYARAQTIVCEETVRLQPLGIDLAWDGTHIRQLVYELRVAWEPPVEGAPPEATVLRQVISVDGRPPRPR